MRRLIPTLCCLLCLNVIAACGGRQSPPPAPENPMCVELPSFLAGHWIHTADGTQTEELWMAPLGERMLGLSRTVGVEGGWFEYLRIERTPESVHYIPSPGGVESVSFVLTSCTATSVVFENPAHDFPTRIEYALTDGLLTARISGLVRGESQAMEWTFSPAP